MLILKVNYRFSNQDERLCPNSPFKHFLNLLWPNWKQNWLRTSSNDPEELKLWPENQSYWITNGAFKVHKTFAKASWSFLYSLSRQDACCTPSTPKENIEIPANAISLNQRMIDPFRAEADGSISYGNRKIESHNSKSQWNQYPIRISNNFTPKKDVPTEKL